MGDRRLLLVLTGLPGAGKTSAARALVDAATHELLRVARVTFDDVEREVARRAGSPAGDEHRLAVWRQARAESIRRVKRALRAPSGDDDAHAASDGAGGAGGAGRGDGAPRDTVVVVDDNMHLRSMRHALYCHCRDVGAAFLQVLLDVPLPVALARNEAREAPQRVPEHVVRRMSESLQPPRGDGTAAGWERGVSVVLDVAELSVEAVAAALLEHARGAFGNVPPPLEREDRARMERDRAATARSAAHAVDLALRGAVKESVAAAKAIGGDVAAAARAANDARRHVMREMAAMDADALTVPPRADYASGEGAAGGEDADATAAAAQHARWLFTERLQRAEAGKAREKAEPKP